MNLEELKDFRDILTLIRVAVKDHWEKDKTDINVSECLDEIKISIILQK